MLEHHNFPSSYSQTLMGLRVSAPAGPFLPHRELAEAADEYMLPMSEGVFHYLENPVNYLLSLLTAYTQLILHEDGQFLFGDGHFLPLYAC